MRFFKEMILEDSIEIKTTPEKIFDFLFIWRKIIKPGILMTT